MLSAGAWEKLRFITTPLCACCGMPFGFGAQDAEALCLSCLRERPAYDTARAALAYDEASRELILRFKHADQTHTVDCFVPWLRLAGRDMLAAADLIVPVPLHRGRLLRRRYNQAGLLAAALARAAGVRWLPHVLRRRRATRSQGFLGLRARRANVRRAFSVPEAQRVAIAGKTVILVDDVYTTGATAGECAKALRVAGAGAVHVLTVARVLRE
jgi:ComF family protein